MPELRFIDGFLSGGQLWSHPSDAPVEENEALDAYSTVVTRVAETLAPSVANLQVYRRRQGERRIEGGGSGVLITPDGFILT
ncbi:MAG: hypothetical protein ACRDKT_08750, partial [Actinomycetota bacterium]